MNRVNSISDAGPIIRRISELRELCRNLARAGRRAGLRSGGKQPARRTSQVAEAVASFRAKPVAVRSRRAMKSRPTQE
jgi:hypothetical protein